MKQFSKTICLTSLAIFSSVLSAQNSLERPIVNSTVSGIYNFSGWDCDADIIEFQFNDGPLKVAASQMPRGDTLGPCGDKDNGYALMWLTALLGDGQHTVRVYADGTLVDTRAFNVMNAASGKYLRNIESKDIVVNFGNQVNLVVSWDESQQNFVVVEKTNEFRTTPPTGVDMSPLLQLCEDPGPHRESWGATIDGYFAPLTVDSTPLCATSYDNPAPVSGAWSNPSSSGQRAIAYNVFFLNEIQGKSVLGDIFILAHEWGHQVQFDNPEWSTFEMPWREYQADCLGGTFMGQMINVPELEITDEMVADLTNEICTSGHPASLSHGDCEGRVDAANHGIAAGKNKENPLNACYVITQQMGATMNNLDEHPIPDGPIE